MAQTLQDIDPFGQENADGTAKEYIDKEALKIALTNWIMSKRGDYIMNPDEGGILDFSLFKNITQESAGIIKFKLEVAFKMFFEGVATFIDAQIVPNNTQRYTEIFISYNDNLTGNAETITLYPKDSTTKIVQVYKDVPLDGENLYNYVMALKPDMLGQKIKYNTDEMAWIWGSNFKLTNLTNTDPYFAQILMYANDL